VDKSKKIIYVDMDNTLCNYTATYNAYKSNYPEIEYPQSIKGFFRAIEPIEGATDTYQWLSIHNGFDVYILTAPSVMNPHCYSEKRLWVEDHLGFDAVRKLIISPHKGLNKGDFLIDDQINGRGQELFEGKMVQFGSRDFPDWCSVKYYLQQNLDMKKVTSKGVENTKEDILKLAFIVFGSKMKAEDWLNTPLISLNQNTPYSRLKTPEGIEQIRSILQKINKGEFT